MSERLSQVLERYSGASIIAAAVVTALLAVPFLTMEPDENASQDPSGEVLEAQDLVTDRFASSVFGTAYIVEARDGNVLTRASLLELFENAAALRADPEIGSKLISFYDPDAGVEVNGTFSLADATDALLRSQGIGGLAAADEGQVEQAVQGLINARGADEWGLSAEADDGTGRWVSPAIFTNVLADSEALGGGGLEVRLGGDTDKEEFARDIQTLLRGDESENQVWGIAIDVNLTSGEQGAAAGPFIGFTILAVLLVVGAVFRSYWAVAICGAALAALIVWLKGLSNLVGLKSDLTLDLIVPIAMISFGVDFAFHAIGRYREERVSGRPPRPALTIGLGAVLGALTLALASDSAAFLSNVASPLESIVQFGIATAMALAAAFVMLGLITPVLLMRIEDQVGRRERSGFGRFLAANATGLAASGAMATVLFMVFLSPPIGVALLAVYIIAFLLVPYVIARRRKTSQEDQGGIAGAGSPRVGRLIVAAAARRAILLPVVAVATGAAVFYAFQIEARFDVVDFFAGDTDFVVSLDKLDEHGGDQAGEPAAIYIQGDLSNPESIKALVDFDERLRQLDDPSLAKADGETQVFGGMLPVFDEVMKSPFALGAVQAGTGVTITDEDGDGYPDTADQIAAVTGVIRRIGVPLDESRLSVTPDAVRTNLWESEDRMMQATIMQVGLVGSRSQENIANARETLAPLISELQSELRAGSPDARVTLTGGPVTRDEQLRAILRSLLIALPISVLLCLLVAGLFMRSLRYAFVSIMPILMVVAWLYAFMYLAGFGVNVVTATIGAISIGIGIDFAIHFTMRYRQEVATAETRLEALNAAGTGTGGALAASAASSIVGFAILALAPMPMFASYGLLTAVMIAMALTASLLVLPSLLMLVTRDREAAET
jgi:predicted RND superfamily exporter protein